MIIILSEEAIDKITERLVTRIEAGNEYILSKIGNTIKQLGTLTPTQLHQLSQIMQYGGDYDKIVKKIAELTNINVKEIYEIFDEVSKNNYQSVKPLYEYRNAPFIPYEENIVLQNQVRAIAQMTANKYVNIMNTLAFARIGKNGRVYYTDIGKMYQEIVDTGILNISQGKETFDSAMTRIIRELGESEIRTVDWESGRSMRVDSAVRMHLKDSLTRLHMETQQIFGEQFNADGVEISVHSNPAPDHALVQGRQFSNEEFEKFQNDKDATSYDGILFPATSEETKHDRRSIGQYNCYHRVFPIILGISKPEYTDEQLQEIIDENNKKVTIDKKEYTKYECTQLQRKLENEIKKEKEKHVLAKASGTDESRELMLKSQEKIDQLTSKYKEVSKKAGLPTYMEKMRVSGYHRIKPATNPTPKPVAKPTQSVVQTPKIDFDKYQEHFEKKNVQLDESLKTLDKDLLATNLEHLDKLTDKYNVVKNQHLTLGAQNSNRYIGTTYYGANDVNLSKKYFKSKDYLLEVEAKNQRTGWHSNMKPENYDIGTLTHEYGHVIENDFTRKYIKDHYGINTSFRRKSYTRTEKAYREEIDRDIRDEIFNEVKRKENLTTTQVKEKYLSGYAKSKRHYEWFAETFSQMELGEQTPLTEAMKHWLERNY